MMIIILNMMIEITLMMIMMMILMMMVIRTIFIKGEKGLELFEEVAQELKSLNGYDDDDYYYFDDDDNLVTGE